MSVGVAPFRKPGPGRVNQQALLAIGRALLEALGEDPGRPGLEDTPRRWAGWWREFLAGAPGVAWTAFPAEGAGQTVAVGPFRVWSLCEHHLLPFWCDLTIGYVPRGRILGLSKFARAAAHTAARLQVQERLAEEVADRVAYASGSPDVAVVARGEHLCLSMRGARADAVMTTSVFRGAFAGPAARAEFLGLALSGRPR